MAWAHSVSLLLVLPLVFTLPASAETASQVFQQASPSVVVVLTYDAAGKATELGSGVKLPDGSVATNCHVLKDGSTYKVRYRGKVYPASLDKADWNRDVCSLSVPGLPAPPVVLGSTRTLQVGAQVYAIGTPEGLQRTLSEGIVSSLRSVGGGSYIQTTAAISPGSSGGGLFDDHGRLLGLTSFFISKGQQLNFALPVEWIEALPQHTAPRVASGTSEVQWINRAAALESRKDWQGLRALAERWIKAQPHNETAWVGLGEAEGALGHDVQAIDAYLQALQINPQNADAWNNLGNAYFRSGQHAQAIEAYRQALQINPQFDLAWNGLGNARDDAGQHSQAIEAERQALQINPQFAQAWYNLGNAYFHSGQYAQAIEAYRQALQINPRYAKAWKNLGIAYGDAGQYAQAIVAERQALEINPQDASAWFLLGISYMLTGQQEQAIAVYQHLKALDPVLAQKLFDLIVPK
jgi:tetratricopeptide (TPR) repeat protein